MVSRNDKRSASYGARQPSVSGFSSQLLLLAPSLVGILLSIFLPQTEENEDVFFTPRHHRRELRGSGPRIPPQPAAGAFHGSDRSRLSAQDHVESLDLLQAARPDIQVFNELLVQYPKPGQRRPGQVVPDNMIVLCDKPIDADGSYDVPLQPAAPFCILEYVSKHNKRKDYDDNFDKYEKELKVPYYLLFYPETQDLTLYRLRDGKYVAVPPNERPVTPSPNWNWRWSWLRDGCAIRFAANCCPCPPNSCAT